MNLKPSFRLSKSNFLLYLSLVFALLFFNNVDSFASVLSEISPKTRTVISPKPTKALQRLQQDHKKSKIPKGAVPLVLNNPPTFPGGMREMMLFLRHNMHYPVDAQKARIEGRVICQFFVKKDGSVTDIHICRGVSKSLDKEALRVLSKMPKWNPGTYKGKKIEVRYTIPITFRLPPKK